MCPPNFRFNIMIRMRYSLFFGIFLLACQAILGQQVIKGLIIDEHSKEPISNAHIYEDSGRNAIISDSQGNFQIEVPDLPAFLSFSHLSYHPKAMMVQFISDKGLEVELTSKDFKINEVVVIADRVQRFLKKEEFYVREMEFGDGFLWVIGYPDKNILKPEIRVLSLGGTSLGKIKMDKSGKLFKDSFGEVHVIYNETVNQLFWNGHSIHQVNPFTKDGSEEYLFNLQASFDSLAIIKNKVGTGVYNEYIAFNFLDSSQQSFHYSFDHELFAASQMAKRHKYRSIPTIIFPPFNPGPNARETLSFDPTDGFTRHAQDRLLTYTPINSKLFKLDKELIIFEDKGPFLWKYGLDIQAREMLAIQVPDRSTKIDLLQDPVSTDLYLLFEIKGLEYISKVDTNSGALINTMQLDGFTFVDNIRVYGNRVYYLDQSKSGKQKMNLFSMEID